MDKSSKKNLLIIAPTAPPEVCGASDQAYLMGQSLSDYFNPQIGTQRVPLNGKGFNYAIPVDRWKTLLPKATKSVKPSVVMLIYTPTSYAITGLPYQMIKELRAFKAANKENKLFVFIHETWSGDPKLKYHHALRNNLVRWSTTQIDKIADGISVCTEEQKERIEKVLTNQIGLAPIGANILPADKKAGLHSKRIAGEWLLFGLAHTRVWTLEAHLEALKVLYAKGILKKIISLGPIDNDYAAKEAQLVTEHLGPDVLVQRGAVKPEEVSATMLTVEAALLGQNPVSLKKSSTFMAMAAHNVPIICTVPETMKEPPAAGFFSSAEIIADPSILTSEKGAGKKSQLYDWFWQTRSWEAIGLSISEWISKGV
jgi:hypothetical protein